MTNRSTAPASLLPTPHPAESFTARIVAENPNDPGNGGERPGPATDSETPRNATNDARLAPLDGLRGLSILIVLLGHGASTADHPALLSPLQNLGIIGVDLFFAISGFIITLLLCRERRRRGRPSLPRFWMRRALRILPPFCVVCLGLWTASRLGVMHWSWPSFFGAATFTKDLPIFNGEWFFGHFWSLSVEEQFYLVWPLVLLLIADELRLLRGLGLLLVLSPLLGALCALYLPALQNLLPFTPYLGAGCLAAVSTHEPRIRTLVFSSNRPARLFLLATLPAIAVLVAYWHRQGVVLPLSLPGEGLLLPAAVLVTLIECVHPDGLLTGIMAIRPLVWLGTISYSVYLWQQLFMGPPEAYRGPWLWSTWPNNVAASIACGAVGYWLIERPSARLKALLNR